MSDTDRRDHLAKEADRLTNDLQAAIDQGVTDIVIAGYRADGSLWFGTSSSDAGAILLILEQAKRDLLERVQ